MKGGLTQSRRDAKEKTHKKSISAFFCDFATLREPAVFVFRL